MEIEVTRDGEGVWLGVIRLNSFINGGDFTMHLFTSETVSDHDPGNANFTSPTWPGYSPYTATGWTAPTHDDTLHAHCSTDPAPFFFNFSATPQFAKGIWITGPSISVVIGWGYFKSDKSDVEIPPGTALLVPTTVRLKSSFFFDFE